MGIILQVQPPKKSSKLSQSIEIPADRDLGDWTTSIVITDPSVHTGDSASEDMVVSVFRPDQRQLTMPPPGSPILFRRLKVGLAARKSQRLWESNARSSLTMAS